MSKEDFKILCDTICRLVDKVGMLECEIISLNTKIEKLTRETKK